MNACMGDGEEEIPEKKRLSLLLIARVLVPMEKKRSERGLVVVCTRRASPIAYLPTWLGDRGG